MASIDTAREKFQLQRYLDSMEKLDNDESPEFDNAGVQAALEKLKHHPEAEVGFMVMGRHTQPAYNLRSAVDAEHALIIAHDVVLDATDNRSLEPMADAAKVVLGKETFHVVADAGYSNGEQAAKCEGNGILPCVPATRTRNPHGDGTFFQWDAFRYQLESDTYLCSVEKTLKRKARLMKDKSIIYLANEKDCYGTQRLQPYHLVFALIWADRAPLQSVFPKYLRQVGGSEDICHPFEVVGHHCETQLGVSTCSSA